MSHLSQTCRLIALSSSFAVLSVACQTTKNFPDRSAEIQQLETQMQAARQQQLDILAPEEFERLKDNIEEAKEQAADHDDTTSDVRDAQAALAELQEKSQATRTVLTEVLEARQMALDAGAEKLRHDQLQEIDEDLRELTERAAKGNIRPIQDKKNEFKNRYANLEADSIVKSNIGAIQTRFEKAKKDDADDDAPKTFKRTQAKLEEAELQIRANKDDEQAIQNAVAMASTEVDRLTKIAADADRLDSEQSAIELYERDQKALAERRRLEGETESLENRLDAQMAARNAATNALEKTRNNLESTQQNLEQAQAEQKLQQRYVEAKNTFNPEEADVYKDGQNLLIRLKGLNFAKGEADLPQNSDRVLSKLDKVIQEFEGAEVKVEGHTDATGSRAINAKLSQERADAVKDYLLSKNIVEDDKVSSEGYGFQKPIASNRSANGRALNRRVDVIITPAEPMPESNLPSSQAEPSTKPMR